MTGIELLLTALTEKCPEVAKQIAESEDPKAELDKLLASNQRWVRLAQKIAGK